jgi:chromosome segregation ATPase
MKTPFDAAIRARRREVDAVKAQIGTAAAGLAALEARRDQLDASLAAERTLASLDWSSAGARYLVHARATLDALLSECNAAAEALAALRARMTALAGALHALEQAADRHRAEAERAAFAAEQAGLDDTAGARIATGRAGARRRQVHAARLAARVAAQGPDRTAAQGPDRAAAQGPDRAHAGSGAGAR